MKRDQINDFIRKNQQLSRKELAVRCGISVNAVNMREKAMGLKKREWIHPSALITGDLKTDREKMKQEAEKKDLGKKYKATTKELSTLEKEFDALLALRERATTFKIVPKLKTDTAEATAVVLLSDWHVEEVVDPKQVNNLNSYNPEIAKARASECFQNILFLLRKEQQAVRINTLVLWLGGDFITNSLRDENLENNAMQPIEAAMYAKELLSSGLKFLQTHAKMKIICVCTNGNHGRITEKVHISTESGNSLETFIYTTLRDEHPDIAWIIEPGANTFLDIYGRIIRFNHGHYVKYNGGIGGLTIPLIKAIGGWDTQRRADLTCIGHFHDQMWHRRFCVNGSLIGFNSFAVAIKAEYEPPTQSMFLIDKERGRTVLIPILFKS